MVIHPARRGMKKAKQVSGFAIKNTKEDKAVVSGAAVPDDSTEFTQPKDPSRTKLK
jgi:hypothetical protein